MHKVAVFFHYFEINEVYKENLIFFLSAAYRQELNFFIIISGACTVDLPNYDNVKYVYTENKNNDFGGYSAVLSNFNRIDDYSFFIFVNSSVRGPFVPSGYDGCWTELFTSKIKDETHLVGSSINILPNNSPYAQKFKLDFGYTQPYSHVQTTAYALSLSAIKHLIKIGFYNGAESLNKEDVICKYELRLSQEIKRNGMNIGCLLIGYNGIDYRLPHQEINFSSWNGDPLCKGGYFGRTARPSELVFVKTNRNLISRYQLYWYTYFTLLSIEQLEIQRWIEFKALKNQCVLRVTKRLTTNLQALTIRNVKYCNSQGVRAKPIELSEVGREKLQMIIDQRM